MKKLFKFNDTISGSTFIIRHVISIILIAITAFFMGAGIGVENNSSVIIFAFLMSLSIYFNIVTIYKRINALFPERLKELMIFIILGNLSILLLEGSPIVILLNLIFVIFNLILTFKNSNITEHKG
jgi:hypothetical protein